MFNNKSNAGSTLIEVLVAIVVVGLVVTGAMLSISYSVKNSEEARYREVATQLAQDGMEVIKLRREIDPWSTFYGYGEGTVRCLDKGYTKLDDTTGCTNNITDNKKSYSRYVVLTHDGGPPQVVTAKVTVEWQSDSNQTMNVEITQEFRERII